MDRKFLAPSKIYEIEAHSRNITCLDLGETAPVLVTGGQDKSVNLWALGKERYEMSLSHNEPVSTVKFGKKQLLRATSSIFTSYNSYAKSFFFCIYS